RRRGRWCLLRRRLGGEGPAEGEEVEAEGEAEGVHATGDEGRSAGEEGGNGIRDAARMLHDGWRLYGVAGAGRSASAGSVVAAVSAPGYRRALMSPAGRHLLHVFPGFDAGGTQMRAVQLMGMLPAGTRHTVLAMDGRYGCQLHVPSGVEVRPLPPPPRASFLAMGRYMRDLLERERPDGVLTSNWGSIEMVLGLRMARSRRGARGRASAGAVPLVHQEDGFGPEEAHRYLRRRIWLRRCLLGNAAAVAVPSRVLADLAV